MSAELPTTLEEAIRHAGEGWLIDWHTSPSEALEHLRRTLDKVNQRAQTMLGDAAPNMTESAIVKEYQRNPLRVKGFLQVMGGSRTPDMLLMAWRIIQGWAIKELHVSYLRQSEFKMRVILESPDGVRDPEYKSKNIKDSTLLHHVGNHEMGGRPIFDGFYPLNLRESGA